jgi:two-component system sensor histidine kinase KdpD
VALDEVVGRALLDHPTTPSVVLEIDEDTPRVLADPGLLERVMANLIANACRFSPPDRVVTVRAEPLVTAEAFASGASPGTVRVLVVDHGGGVPSSSWEEMFVPFQRLGDQHASGGVGLGLAIARGFMDAMGGSVAPQQTPGGGLTMVVSLPVAAS